MICLCIANIVLIAQSYILVQIPKIIAGNLDNYLFVTLKCMADHLGIGCILKYIGIVHQFSGSLSALLNGVLDLRFKTGFLENYLNFADQFTKRTAREAAEETARRTAGEAHRKESPGRNASIRLGMCHIPFPIQEMMVSH